MVRLAPRLRPYFPYLKAAYTLGTRAAAPATVQLSRLRGGFLPWDAADTMEDAALDDGRIWPVRPPETSVRPLPLGIPADDPAFVDNVTEDIPRVAILELRDGRVLGPHAAVITARGRLVWELSSYFGTSRPHEHPMYLHPFPGPPLDVKGSVGVLASRGDANYYHFLHDCLPRLGVLEQCPAVEAPERWYVAQQTSFQRELLDLMGIPEERRIDSTKVPHIRAERLVLPGLASDIVRNPPWVSQFLRRRLVPDGVVRVPGRHIYATRGALRHNRMVLNEDEVVALLASRGFEVVDPGTMSVAEQVRTFAEADVIVAAHGAALANLPFCSPGATILELFPSASMVPDYWKMASGVIGLEYRYLGGTGPAAATDRAGFLVSDILVDVALLEGMVDEIIAEHGRST